MLRSAALRVVVVCCSIDMHHSGSHRAHVHHDASGGSSGTVSTGSGDHGLPVG